MTLWALFVVQSLSPVPLFVTLWTEACQAPFPSPSPRVYSNSRPLSRWYYPTISSSAAPFSSCPRSSPASVFSSELARHISSVQFSRSVVSDSLQFRGLQHTRPPCPSLTPGVYSNSCPLSRWCHPTISSSVIPFSSWPQSFPTSGSFQMSQLFASGGQIKKPKYLEHCSRTAVKWKV